MGILTATGLFHKKQTSLSPISVVPRQGPECIVGVNDQPSPTWKSFLGGLEGHPKSYVFNTPYLIRD
jgi:hypothetical protein